MITKQFKILNKFLGLKTDNRLSLKNHTEYMIPKIISACFAMITVTPLFESRYFNTFTAGYLSI
jgi:hypothetical protein